MKPSVGPERVLTFMGDTGTSGNDEVKASKTNGLWAIEVDDCQHYEVSESVISGGRTRLHRSGFRQTGRLPRHPRLHNRSKT